MAKSVYMTITETINALFFAWLVICLHTGRAKCLNKDFKDLTKRKVGVGWQEKNQFNIYWTTCAATLLRSCYCVHISVYVAVFSHTRQPLSTNSANYVSIDWTLCAPPT